MTNNEMCVCGKENHWRKHLFIKFIDTFKRKYRYQIGLETQVVYTVIDEC